MVTPTMITPFTAQPATATVTLAMLQAVVDGAMAKCPDLATHLDKAAGLLATGRVQAGDTRGVWWVGSETDPTHAAANNDASPARSCQLTTDRGAVAGGDAVAG